MTPLTDLIGDKPLRALTLNEPFASLMLQDKIETRKWPTKYRGWVLICAAKKPYSFIDLQRMSRSQINRINAAFGFDDLYRGEAEGYYCGYAFAVGRLVDCRPMKPEDESRCYVDWVKGLHCHIYENIAKIEPFQWKGVQGWKTVDPDLVRKIILL
jgi:hypothetical protein